MSTSEHREAISVSRTQINWPEKEPRAPLLPELLWESSSLKSTRWNISRSVNGKYSLSYLTAGVTAKDMGLISYGMLGKITLGLYNYRMFRGRTKGTIRDRLLCCLATLWEWSVHSVLSSYQIECLITFLGEDPLFFCACVCMGVWMPATGVRP